MVSFKPLGNTELRAFQCLITLDVNDVTVLVDTGWDESLSEETLSELVEMIPNIDLILLTHATVGHTGAFCYLRHKYPQFRAIPAYATLPVIRMSQMMTLELYRNAGLCGPFDNPEAMPYEEVEDIWSEVNNVKYSQPLKLHNNPKLEGTMITAYNGGHTLGGSLWKIYDGVDSVVISLDWNHARDAHLNGAFLEPKTGTVVGDLQKPSLLITSTSISSGQPLTKARQSFLNNIDDALKQQGTVLIPTSSGSRILELILILEKHMSTNHKDIPLIYCNKYGKQALTQASSMLEWMVPSIIGDWQVQNESPFDTSHVHYTSNVASLRQKWPIGPKVVLAAGECLESGPSKEIFLDLVAEDANSSVIINELCPPETLGSRLLSGMDLTKTGLTHLNLKLPQVALNTSESLTGESLEAYNKKRESEREHAVITAAQERRNQQLIDTSAQADEESSDSDEDNEEFDQSHLGSGVLLYSKNVYDYDCETAEKETDENNESNFMFPFNSKRRKADEYGEYIPSGLFNEKPQQQQAQDHPESNEKNESLEPNNNINSNENNIENNASRNEERQKQRPRSNEDDEDDFMNGVADQVDDPALVEDEQPAMLVKTIRKNIQVACGIAYSDMNGITNSRSLQMVLKQVQPMRTIALPGSEDVCQQLQKQCPNFELGDKPVSFARTNFSVDVRLDPSMKLEWHDLIGGYSVARVGGTLEFDPHDRIKKSGAVLVLPSPEVAKETPEATAAKTKSITIGDLRLTALRKVLNDEGMKAEFRSQGVLVCNDKVVVQKMGDGSYVLQGGIDEDYYRVRTAIRQFVTTM